MEAALRAAIAAGDTRRAWFNLGLLLSEQPGRARWDEAEAAYRAAIATGNPGARMNLGNLLTLQGRADEAEALYRAAIAAGDREAQINLGGLLATQPGREGEAKAALREALAAGHNWAWGNLGDLLSQQPGREGEAEAAYRHVLDDDCASAQRAAQAAVSLGELLARRGDVTGARGAFETHGRIAGKYMGLELADSTIARIGRFRTTVARRRRALRLQRSVGGAVARRLVPVVKRLQRPGGRTRDPER